eukprot:TRINITY_DN11617_c0_g1_i1.p1 TRINITY_DN11617_c0_g1~~TRINITY_DN11617_c0_g1_i1.p1  ORF type:complete len:447 (-),score=145.57 TRINITY_DN11617_c0_g1_i1:565-1827(-)
MGNACARRKAEEDPADEDPDAYMLAPGELTPEERAAKEKRKEDEKAAQAAKEEAKKNSNIDWDQVPHKTNWEKGDAMALKDGEIAMLKGNTYLLRGDYQCAEEAFAMAAALKPDLVEAHVGHLKALRKQEKLMRAYSVARMSLEKLPGNQEILDMRQMVLDEYQAKKAKDREAQELRKIQAAKTAKEMIEEEKRMKAQGKSCPGEGNVNYKIGSTANASDEEREAWKLQMLDVYRLMYKKMEDESKSQFTSRAVETAASGYSQVDKQGLVIQDGHQHMPRPTDVVLPDDFRKSVGIIDMKKLSAYDCESQRLLISVYGDIFDVSDRPDKYGKDGPYYYFAGADITYGLASGKDDDANVNKYYDVWKLPTMEQRDKKLGVLCSWLGFYEREYGDPVGRLEVYDNERNLPPPPIDEGECCIM